MWPLLAAALASEDPARFTLTVDPLTTALGYVHLQAEARLGRWTSVYAGPHLRLFSPPWGPAEPYRGYGGELGVRVFPWGAAPRGPWVMARGVLASVHGGGEVSPGGYVSALAGATWIPDAPKGRVRPVLSGGAGVQWIDYGVAGYGTRTAFLALHTNAGIAW